MGAPDFPVTASMQEQLREYYSRKIIAADPSRINDTELQYGNVYELYIRLVNEGTIPDYATAADIPSNSVIAFGVKADGVTNDTARTQAALNASAGKTLIFPKGTYKIDPVTIPSNTTVVLQGGATILHTNTGAVFRATGTQSATKTNCSVDVVQNSFSVTAPGHGLVAGDTFRLSCNTLFDASSTSIKHGEILTVDSVAGDVITTTDPVQGSAYTTAAVSYVQKLVPVENVKIIGSGKIQGLKSAAMGQYGIDILIGKNCLVQGITTENIDRRHIYLGDCQDTWVDSVTCRWAVDNTMAYGISIANCTQDSGVRFSNFYFVRHSVTTNNETAYPGIPRRNRYHFNKVHSTSTALGGSMGGGDAIDTHTAAEDFWIENNEVISSAGQGINLECRSGRIINNKIKNCVGLGISVHNESDLPGRADILWNHVSFCGGGIYARTGARGTTLGVYEQLNVSSNIINNCSGIALQIGWSSATTAAMTGVLVTNNTFMSNTGTYALFMTNAQNVTNRDNKFVSGVVTISDTTTSTVTDHEGWLARTIASDAITITPTARLISLNTEGAAATDNLATISGGQRGQIITVRTTANSQDVVIVTSGNLRTLSAFTLDAARDSMSFFYDGTNWIETARADHPAA